MSHLPEPHAKSAAQKFLEGAGRALAALVRAISSLISGLFNLVLGPDTFLGRWLRRSIRAIAASVIFFIAGFLLVYLLLYQPALRQLAETQASLRAATARLTELENSANTLAAQMTTAENRVRQLNQSLEGAEARNAHLHVLSRVWAAHSFLLEEDLAAAEAQLVEIEPAWPTLIAAVEKQDRNLAETMRQRLEIVKSELRRNPDVARSDLKILLARLSDAENLLLRR